MESTVTICKAVKQDRIGVTEMRFQLWPDGPFEEQLSAESRRAVRFESRKVQYAVPVQLRTP